ncbi:Transposon Ty3-I Gag-Pol polyprotein [Araneus ventricosus]|uniref:Transposon Ty3-I Gag-Pol polyprotein n=1 Tax=Araneus ventricosus TaxID=182803 RepID=A0A4Y2RFM0_ARAVE|nr:Transposon Ty3-I Gag-Pol polyprotein [Araneus ventricosus]
MCGRHARGPLAVLKSPWSREVPLPTNISQSAVDYLQELKLKMEQTAEQVKIFAERKQQFYADYFNRKTISKSFMPGDQVYLLIPDSRNKMYARCTGPGEIIKHIPPHSYLVKLPDGSKLEKAKVEGHKIQLIPNLERKKPYIYRIPEALRGKVDEQIRELLAAGLIEESDSDTAHPVDCVYKKDGSVRLCVDYRTLNVVTKPDDIPMENAVNLMYNIGKANIVTTLDLLKGYWAIPVEVQSKDYTSFKTHRSQYRLNVLPFGLKNAAATFQRVMNNSLKEVSEFAKAYIDDIAIYSADVGTHLKHIDCVFTKLGEMGFTVNTKSALS